MRSENIRNGVEWSIEQNALEVVVHLSGEMAEFESELDGQIASRGRPAPGEIWIAPLGSRYSSRAKGGDVSYAVFSLDISDDPNVIGHQGVRDAFLFATAHRLRDSIKLDRPEETLFAEQLLSLARSHILTSYTQLTFADVREEKLPLSEPARRRLQEFIYDRLDQQMSVSILSEIAGVPEHSFNDAFKRSFELTPAQYIIKQRLRRAQWLLSQTADPIAQIALATGFSNHSHLSNTFKQNLGETPSQFRKRWRYH